MRTRIILTRQIQIAGPQRHISDMSIHSVYVYPDFNTAVKYFFTYMNFSVSSFQFLNIHI